MIVGGATQVCAFRICALWDGYLMLLCFGVVDINRCALVVVSHYRIPQLHIEVMLGIWLLAWNVCECLVGSCTAYN